VIGTHEVELVIGKGVPVLNLADEMPALALRRRSTAGDVVPGEPSLMAGRATSAFVRSLHRSAAGIDRYR
jgi:hypothetical protein